MPDYQCYPLWFNSKEDFGNISPDEFPLSLSLKESLSSWQNEYDATLNIEDPFNSGFKNEHEEKLFGEKGFQLWNKLIDELGEKYSIQYFNVVDGKLYDNVSDPK